MTAFEQGYAAFLKGLQRDENPFDAETCSFSLKRWTGGTKPIERARRSSHDYPMDDLHNPLFYLIARFS